MPLHLELGSDGHSFHGKAIVVNSITGKHYSHAPIPLKKAEAQKRVIEGAMEKHGEHVTASGRPSKKIDPPLKVSAEVAQERKARHEAKKLKPAKAKVAMLHEKMPEHEHDMSIAPLKAKKAGHETAYPLVSKEDYVKHLKLLKSAMAGKKALVKDRHLQAELALHFFDTGRMNRKGQAFLNGLTSIYNDATKSGGKYKDIEEPKQLDWLDWFDASKTDQEDGMTWAQTDNYRLGALEKYFNIYPDNSGKRGVFHHKNWGYFYGFSPKE
jgi:hypothetical protein